MKKEIIERQKIYRRVETAVTELLTPYTGGDEKAAWRLGEEVYELMMEALKIDAKYVMSEDERAKMYEAGYEDGFNVGRGEEKGDLEFILQTIRTEMDELQKERKKRGR